MHLFFSHFLFLVMFYNWINWLTELGWTEVKNSNYIACKTKGILYLKTHHNSKWYGTPVFIILSSYFGILWQLCHRKAQHIIYLNPTTTAPGSWGQISSISFISFWVLHHIFSANIPFILKHLSRFCRHQDRQAILSRLHKGYQNWEWPAVIFLL